MPFLICCWQLGKTVDWLLVAAGSSLLYDASSVGLPQLSLSLVLRVDQSTIS